MLIISGIIIIIIIAAIFSNNNSAKRITKLKQQYEKSLRGTDKCAALNAGRAYYSALRKNKALTLFDEQSITNDLSAMN